MTAPSPISAWLGFSAGGEGGERLYRLAFNETHIGNPAIRALHGGVIAAFLELAMQTELKATGAGVAETVNLSIDYMSSSRAEDMTATVKILRVGRRLAFLEAEGRQAGGTRLVALARACLKLG
jgi:uncharacterized protein (TIGR00369 family)